MNQKEVFGHIATERAYQDAKWGTIEQHPHTTGEWILILQKELQEARNEWCGKKGDAGALEEILQVAAVAVAAIEQHGEIIEDLRGKK